MPTNGILIFLIMIKGEIPCPRYISNFIRWRFELSDKEILDLEQHDPLGILFKGILLIQQSPGFDIDYDLLEEKFGDTLPFQSADERITYDLSLIHI